MEVKNHIVYNIKKSAERIQEILDSNNSNYEEKGNIVPSRDTLTYNNGYYVNITALFIDIVGSSNLGEGTKRPVLAKIYRTFISECIAIISSCTKCKEVNINGDCVWGVFETPTQVEINIVFSIACMLNAFIKLLNKKLLRKGYQTVKVGIGLDYGRALMIKAGYKGSTINDVVWMGDVVNNACHLANKAGRGSLDPIVVSSSICSSLNFQNNPLLRPYFDQEQSCIIYQGDLVNTNMKKWINNN